MLNNPKTLIKIGMSFSLCLLLPLSLAWASGGEEAPAPAAGEHGGATPAPAGGEHGGGAAPAATGPVANPNELNGSGRQSLEWIELTNKVSAAKGKVDVQREIVKHLIEQKQSIEKQEALNKHVEQLMEENKKLNKLIDDYEAQKSLLQYRFPEKGMTEARKYERVEKKGLSELENDITLDGQLRKSLAKMRKQFKAPPPTEEEQKRQAKKDALIKKRQEAEQAKIEAERKKVEEDSVLSTIKIVK